MSRTKILAAAAAALLAMAVSAPIASAEGPALFKFGAEKINFAGVHEGTEEFTFEYGVVKCNVATYGGSINSPGKAGAELCLSPTYLECETGAGAAVEVKRESCFWDFTSGNEEGGKFEGELDLECQKAGDELTFIARLGGIVRCTIGIPAQQGLKSITYTNKAGAKKDLTIDIGVTSMAYFQTAGTGIFKCNTLGKADGQYSAHPTVIAADEMGKSADLWIE